MNKKEFRMVAYNVRVGDIPLALSLMNEPKSYDTIFESQVVDVILPEDRRDSAIVLVQIHGSYPFIQNKWDKVIVT